MTQTNIHNQGVVIVSEIRELSKRDRDILKQNFPNHRFGHLGKDTPDWVEKTCANARRELIESGMLLPYAMSEVIGLGAGSEFKIIERGTLICSSNKDGSEQIALLLGEERAWLIAHWNSKTGEVLQLPTIGCPVQMPSGDQKEEMRVVRQKALQQAKEELKQMEKKDLHFLIFLLIVGAIFTAIAIFAK